MGNVAIRSAISGSQAPTGLSPVSPPDFEPQAAPIACYSMCTPMQANMNLQPHLGAGEAASRTTSPNTDLGTKLMPGIMS